MVVASGLRLGVDFGTSTTQVAAYVEGRSPFLLQLEDLTEHMPSYFALDVDGAARFGATALNLPENIHSIKPLLADDLEIDGVGHPSKIAFLMLEEVVRRSIKRLRDQRLIPASMERLEVAVNLGCTPRFELDARVRLRTVAEKAGLQVKLASLIEEPIAAAYEVMLSGLVTDGRVLIVDMGGGTLDTAVVKVSDGARSFELFASGGTVNAGDRFTEVIANEIQARIRSRGTGIALSRADVSLIWLRAEAAKLALSTRRSAIVALGGIAGIEDETQEITRDWFYENTARLRLLVEHDVENVYRLARLVLDRGGQFDPAPGTVDFDEPTKGRIRRLSMVGLRDDAMEHIDRVVLVGGGTNLPMVADIFRDVFGDRVVEPELVAIDRSAIVALGLSRPKPPDMSNLRFPSWGVTALFETPDGDVECPLYEPYAPTFHISGGQTAEYRYAVDVPASARSLAIAFRSVDGTGQQWPRVPLAGGKRLEFGMDLFGTVEITSDGKGIYRDGLRAPWSPAEADEFAAWLPPWRPRTDWWVEMPKWDMRNDK